MAADWLLIFSGLEAPGGWKAVNLQASLLIPYSRLRRGQKGAISVVSTRCRTWQHLPLDPSPTQCPNPLWKFRTG